MKEQSRWTYVDITQSIIAVQDRKGAMLNSADILDLCEHDAFDGVTARIFKDWHWKTLPVEARPLTAVTVPFAAVNSLARQEFGRQAIIKYRHPPNVEDIRDVYSMLFKDRTFAWTNFKRYLFDRRAAHLLRAAVALYCAGRRDRRAARGGFLQAATLKTAAGRPARRRLGAERREASRAR